MPHSPSLITHLILTTSIIPISVPMSVSLPIPVTISILTPVLIPVRVLSVRVLTVRVRFCACDKSCSHRVAGCLCASGNCNKLCDCFMLGRSVLHCVVRALYYMCTVLYVQFTVCALYCTELYCTLLNILYLTVLYVLNCFVLHCTICYHIATALHCSASHQYFKLSLCITFIPYYIVLIPQPYVRPQGM